MKCKIQKVSVLTSGHSRFDTRIFYKQSLSLSKKYQVYLIVADGLGNKKVGNIEILDVGKPINRLYRFFVTPFVVYKNALKTKADVYHLHDPELLFISCLLKERKVKIIFDSHEDYQLQILFRPYLNKYIAFLISQLLFVYLLFFLPKVDGIVCATDEIKRRLIRFNKNIVTIKNYPITKK
jgi:hypothetical protein